MADAHRVDPEDLESDDEEVELLDEDVEAGARQGDALRCVARRRQSVWRCETAIEK